jgi:hypothetical protein
VISNFSDSFTREGSHLLTGSFHVWAATGAEAYRKATDSLERTAAFFSLDAPVESHEITRIYEGFYRVDFATDGSLGTPEEDEGHQRDYPLTD